jgi:hypothetical protein
MANNKTTQAENDVLDWLLQDRDVGCFLALFTGDPGEAGSVTNEVVAAVGYTRQAITFGDAASGASANSADVTFGPASGAGFGTVTHAGICRAGTRDVADIIYYGPLTSSRLVEDTDTLVFATGEVDVSEE